MIRMLLVVLGGLAAWRYRGAIKEYLNQELPQLQKKATEMVSDAADQLSAVGRSSADRRERRA